MQRSYLSTNAYLGFKLLQFFSIHNFKACQSTYITYAIMQLSLLDVNLYFYNVLNYKHKVGGKT